jgi:hypothetical protein
MLGRRLHLFIVAATTLVSLSLSLILEAPKILGKAATVAVDTSILGQGIVLTDHHLVWIKVTGILLVVLFNFAIQYKQVYKPFVKFEELRQAAFDQVFAPEIEKLRRSVTPELRFNIMRRTTYLKFTRHIQIGRLRHIYHYGYRHDDRDKSLRLWYVRFFNFERGEGIAGTTYLTEQPTIADLRNAGPGNAKLSGRKLELTRNTKLIISFPVFHWMADRYACVGTINVDISDEAVAATMFAEQPLKRLQKLAQYVQDCAEYVSLWL